VPFASLFRLADARPSLSDVPHSGRPGSRPCSGVSSPTGWIFRLPPAWATRRSPRWRCTSRCPRPGEAGGG